MNSRLMVSEGILSGIFWPLAKRFSQFQLDALHMLSKINVKRSQCLCPEMFYVIGRIASGWTP